jgi:uncharacterized PurR-regulated membrane protein YhhQ (DUF165 family)
MGLSYLEKGDWGETSLVEEYCLNGPTVVSQFIDTLIFITIAFYGTMPVLPLIKGQYFVKVLIALLDTPFVYLVVMLIRREYSIGGLLLRR